jgi:hypothetical protein
MFELHITLAEVAEKTSFVYELFINFDKIILGITKDCHILASTDIKS